MDNENEFMKFLMMLKSMNDAREMHNQFAGVARIIKDMHNALMEVGFEEGEAFDLTLALTEGIIKETNK